MILGYQFISHTQQYSLGSLVRHIITMLCVYGMVMNWKLYQLFVYNIFTNEPANIAQILVNSTGNSQTTVSLSQALDGLYKTIIDTTIGFFGQINFSPSGLAFIFYGGLVFIIGTLMCVFALLLFIYAKMVMSIALALGPIFILMILWESTKGMFSAWLKILITIAFIPIVTSAILALMLSVINVTLPNINQPTEAMQFYGIAPFLGLTLTTTLILSQVFRICSALGGGITLASLSAGVSIAKSVLEKAGITSPSRPTKYRVQNKTRKAKNSRMRD